MDFIHGGFGYTSDELFTNSIFGYTYDDIILMPNTINFPVSQVDLTTNLSKRIQLKAPIVSSPMDTVTESRMSINLALQGGLGFIHCCNTTEQQVWKVENVKRWRNGFISRPFCIKPDASI